MQSTVYLIFLLKRKIKRYLFRLLFKKLNLAEYLKQLEFELEITAINY